MTISTKLHHYHFDLDKPEERNAYEKLRNGTLLKIGFPVWEIHFHGYHHLDRKAREFMQTVKKLDGRIVELETKHLFSNQWNSAAGLRLFNWAECRFPNKSIREGYWLEQTDAMRQILRETLKCRFCGAYEPAASGITFCPHCLDSEYLEESELHLTRMVPVCDTDKPVQGLTDAELAERLPLFRKAQIHGIKKRETQRITAARRDVQAKYSKAVAQASEKKKAALWILDNAPGIYDNWIYYAHTGQHCFGWRKPLSAGEESELLDVITEFPFRYTIKRANGPNLDA